MAKKAPSSEPIARGKRDTLRFLHERKFGPWDRRISRWSAEKELLTEPSRRRELGKKNCILLDQLRRKFDTFSADEKAKIAGFEFYGDPPALDDAALQAAIDDLSNNPPLCRRCTKPIPIERARRALLISRGRWPAVICDDNDCRRAASARSSALCRARSRLPKERAQYELERKAQAIDARFGTPRFPVFSGLADACDSEFQHDVWIDDACRFSGHRVLWGEMWPRKIREAYRNWREDGGYFKREGASWDIDGHDDDTDRVTPMLYLSEGTLARSDNPPSSAVVDEALLLCGPQRLHVFRNF